MEGEQCSSRQLPEHLVETIIARMPFPSIFKARTLSKAWLARFSAINEGRGKATTSPVIAATFQKLVTDRSNVWEICGPVSILYDHGECQHPNKVSCRPCYANCYAYNSACQTWQRIPSLSFVAGSFSAIEREMFTTEGALVFLLLADSTGYGGQRRRRLSEKLYVANILTRSYRLLPARSRLEEERILLPKIVIDLLLQTYKLVLFVENFVRERSKRPRAMLTSGTVGVEVWVHIFNSRTCSWSRKKLVGVPNRDNWFLSSAVYLNGALYMLAGAWGCSRLIAFDMEEETLKELSIRDAEQAIHGRRGEYIYWLVVCGGELFIICSKRTVKNGSDLYFRVLQVDLKLETISVVAEGPPRMFSLKSGLGRLVPVGHGGCIYFGVERDIRTQSLARMPVCNVQENSWSCISSCPDASYTGCCFEPGFSPFIAV